MDMLLRKTCTAPLGIVYNECLFDTIVSKLLFHDLKYRSTINWYLSIGNNIFRLII